MGGSCLQRTKLARLLLARDVDDTFQIRFCQSRSKRQGAEILNHPLTAGTVDQSVPCKERLAVALMPSFVVDTCCVRMTVIELGSLTFIRVCPTESGMRHKK